MNILPNWGIKILVLTASLCLFKGMLFSNQLYAEEVIPVKLEAIEQSWKRIESNSRTVSLDWSEKRRISRGFISQTTPKIENPSGDIIPPNDALCELECSFRLDGDKMRHEKRGRDWSWAKKTFIIIPYVSAYDGEDSVIYWPPSEKDHGQATIGKENFNLDISNYHLKPILLAFRPISLAGAGSSNYVRSVRKGAVDTRAVVILEEIPKANRRISARSLWVDPTRGFSILRYVLNIRKDNLIQIDINYKGDSGHGWMLEGWTITHRIGMAQQISTCKVTEIAVNTPIDIQQFRVGFAPGTVVANQKNGKRYVQKEDGAKRYFERRKLGPEQVVRSEGKWSSWFVFLVGLFIVSIFYCLWFWQRGTRKNPS